MCVAVRKRTQSVFKLRKAAWVGYLKPDGNFIEEGRKQQANEQRSFFDALLITQPAGELLCPLMIKDNIIQIPNYSFHQALLLSLQALLGRLCVPAGRSKQQQSSHMYLQIKALLDAGKCKCLSSSRAGAESNKEGKGPTDGRGLKGRELFVSSMQSPKPQLIEANQ